MTSSVHIGVLAGLGATACWTFSPLCVTTVAKSVGSLATNVARLFLASVMFALWAMMTHHSPLPPEASWQTWGWLGLSGFIGFFVGDLCLLEAFVLIGPRLSMLIMTLAPLMAAALGALTLGASERIGLLGWAGMIVTLAGVGWVVMEKPAGEDGVRRGHSVLGVSMAVLGALGQAVGLILSKYGMGLGEVKYDPVATTQIRAMAGFLAFAVLAGFQGLYPRVFLIFRKPKLFGLILLGSVFGPVVGVALLMLSVQCIPSGVAQTLASLTPVTILPLVMILHKERVSARAFIGAAIAVAGVGMLVW